MPGSLFDLFLIALRETAVMIGVSGGLSLAIGLPLVHLAGSGDSVFSMGTAR